MKKSILPYIIFFFSCFSLLGQTEFKLKFQAKRLSKSCFTVTRDENNVAGAIWWPNKVDLSKELELHFLVYLGDKDDGGADGLGFVLHNDSRGIGVDSDNMSGAKGEVGGGLYFGDHPSQPGGNAGYGRAGTDLKITPSVAIEMDTYQNTGCSGLGGQNDPVSDHTTVVYNGEICTPKFTPIQFHATKSNVEDNTCYPAVIKWKPGTNGSMDELSLYVDGVWRFTHKDYMIRDVFGGVTNVFYGFTGSTGGKRNEQTICIFDGNSTPQAKNDYASTPYGTPVDVDVQVNDGDTDGDDIFTTKIVVAPQHGTASILNMDKVRYTPYGGFAGLDSLKYEIVDIDPTLTSPDKCYVNRTQAWVYFNKVECPTFTLKAEKVKDNDKCDDTKPDNGQAKAYMLDGTTQIIDFIDFKWYKGTFTAADLVSRTPDFTGSSVSLLPDGPYTIQASLMLSSECTFNLAYLKIDRTQIKPDFTPVLTSSATTCNPSNGAVEVVFATPGTDYANYTFRWYEVYPTVIGTTYKLTNLAPKTYTVSVTNNISGCNEIKTITVPSTFVSPSITATSIDRTSCIKNDGELNAKANGKTTGYEFRWAVATDKKFLNPFIGPVYSNLDTGLYYVTAKDLVTGCPLVDTLAVRVNDGRKYPVIDGHFEGKQTSCDGSKPNGTIDITGIDNMSPRGNYDWDWFKGDNTSVPLDPTKHADMKAWELPKGKYTVLITNKKTGCSSKLVFEVVEEKDSPVVQLVKPIINQTKCSPANGEISVTVDPDGAGPKAATTNNYTFKWWKGGTVKTTTPDYTGSVLTGLSAGQYVVQVTSVGGCQAQEIYTIDPPTVYPTAVLSPTDDNSCDPSLPNGKVVAVASGTGPFTYQWYIGSGTSTAIAGATTTTITGLRNNTYTVKITDTSTGCFITEEAKVDQGVPPTVTVSATPSNVTCFNMNGTYNGSITASVGGPTSGYTYKWYKGNQVKVTADFAASNVYSGLMPGEYTVVAINDATHCASDPVTVTVGQTLSFNVNINQTGTLSGCIASGAMLTAVPTVAGTYSYSWYNGDPDLTAYPFFSASRLLPNGNLDHYDIILPKKYTVVVTNTVTGCYVIKAEDLTGASNIPAVKLKVVNNTSCDAAKPNGRVEIEYIWPNSQDLATKVYPTAGKFPGYEVDWIEGATESTPPSLTNDSASYGARKAGSYGVRVRISTDPNDCPSAFTPAKIINVYDYPVLSPAVVTHKTNCPPDASVKSNGKIEITITNYTGNASDYGYTVVKTGDPSFVPTATLSNKLTIIDLDLGTYTVTIFKVGTACATNRVATISDAHVTPTAPLLRVNNTNCKTLSVDYNGKIEDVTPNLIKYKYLWFRSSDNIQMGDLTGNTPYIDALAPGKYYLILVDRITYCSSSIIEREVINMNVVPYISQSGSTDRTYCASVFDGSATITLGPKIWSGYILKWYDRLGTEVVVTTSNVSANKFIAQNLDSGTYTLEAYDGLNGCSNSTQIKVGLNQTFPEVALTATPNTKCIPLTGTLIATYAGSNPNPLVGYKWQKVSNGVLVPMANITSNVGPVEQGDYAVSVIDSKGCESDLIQRTVIDSTPKSQINLVNFKHQSSCDEATKANGLIQITTKPYGKAYSYNWRKDGSPFAPSIDTSLINLKAGQYIVEVTTDGCVARDTFNILFKKASFVPTIAKQNVSRCVYPYDGFLAASVDGNTSGYTFQWDYIDSAKVYNSAEIASLAQGVYSLKVTNTSTGCDTTLKVILGFDAKPFDIQVTELTPVSNCDFVNRPNGKMVASVDGEVSGYRFDWYESANVTASTPVKFTGNAQNTLRPVIYTLRVTNLITGCSKDQQVTPTFLPVVVAVPTLDSVRGVTSCIQPNGYAEVSAGGSNANHIFNWYIGTEIKPVPDYTGYYQNNLDIGDYLVTATDRFSGCTSSAIKISIGDEKVFVDIKALTSNSLCYNNTGSASITWIEAVGVDKIELNTGGEVLVGDYYSELPVGEFEVTLETTEGCVSKKIIKIDADYFIYNGVSPNGDRKNDFLAIDCIELFPKNIVKIFNRAGALVYVGEGYDNESVRFEGMGNRGVYVSSNHVPDGTYFYVVDPGDGRKPKAGFFELIR